DNAVPAAPAPTSLRKSRLPILMSGPLFGFLRGEELREGSNLRLCIAFGDLVHDRRRTLPVAEFPQLLGEVVLGLAGEVRQPASVYPIRAVAQGARGRQVTALVGVGLLGRSRCTQGGERQSEQCLLHVWIHP